MWEELEIPLDPPTIEDLMRQDGAIMARKKKRAKKAPKYPKY